MPVYDVRFSTQYLHSGLDDGTDCVVPITTNQSFVNLINHNIGSVITCVWSGFHLQTKLMTINSQSLQMTLTRICEVKEF